MSRTLLAIGPVLALLASGCTPTCDQACAKIDRCGLQSTVQEAECATSCARELGRYRDDDDRDLIRAFNEQRRCIWASTCEELEDGVCYDEELFPYSQG